MDLGTTALDPRSGSRRLLDYTYIRYHIGITTDHFGHTPIGACVWFDSTDRRYGGQSDEVPPVPVPNTVVKLVCVTLRTGVGDPLGEAFRRRPLIIHATTETGIWRFDSATRHYSGHSGGVTSVPIPNTANKPTCVPPSTGVGDPLGNVVRRSLSYSYPPLERGLSVSTDTSDRVLEVDARDTAFIHPS